MLMYIRMTALIALLGLIGCVDDALEQPNSPPTDVTDQEDLTCVWEYTITLRPAETTAPSETLLLSTDIREQDGTIRSLALSTLETNPAVPEAIQFAMRSDELWKWTITRETPTEYLVDLRLSVGTVRLLPSISDPLCETSSPNMKTFENGPDPDVLLHTEWTEEYMNPATGPSFIYFYVQDYTELYLGAAPASVQITTLL